MISDAWIFQFNGQSTLIANGEIVLAVGGLAHVVRSNVTLPRLPRLTSYPLRNYVSGILTTTVSDSKFFNPM